MKKIMILVLTMVIEVLVDYSTPYAIDGLKKLLKRLDNKAKKTKTKIDDKLLEVAKEIINKATSDISKKNGLT